MKYAIEISGWLIVGAAVCVGMNFLFCMLGGGI